MVDSNAKVKSRHRNATKGRRHCSFWSKRAHQRHRSSIWNKRALERTRNLVPGTGSICAHRQYIDDCPRHLPTTAGLSPWLLVGRAWRRQAFRHSTWLPSPIGVQIRSQRLCHRSSRADLTCELGMPSCTLSQRGRRTGNQDRHARSRLHPRRQLVTCTVVDLPYRSSRAGILSSFQR